MAAWCDRESVVISTVLAWVRAWGFSWQGWLDNRRGEWWLLAQLLLIALDLLLPRWPQTWRWPLAVAGWLPLLGGLVLLGGLLLALVAVLHLGESLTPLPQPMAQAPLQQQGLYRLCRHPLYLAVLVCSLGMALLRGGWLHPLLLVALAVLLVGKARREERALLQQYPDYASYRQHTPALVPGLPGLDWR